MHRGALHPPAAFFLFLLPLTLSSKEKATGLDRRNRCSNVQKINAHTVAHGASCVPLLPKCGKEE